MALTIYDKQLAEQLRRIAEQERRSVEDVISDALKARYPAPKVEESQEERTQAFWHRMYERARRYWRVHGNLERAALTDEKLKEQFWLFDQDGIPRLKVDEGTFELIDNSLVNIAEAGEYLKGYPVERTDLSENKKEILHEIYAEKARKSQSTPDLEELARDPERAVRRRAYERARRYWREHNDLERAALTDAELDEQFWLIDQNGIPRLKSDEGTFELVDNSLMNIAGAGEYLKGNPIERTDLSQNTNDILGEIYAEEYRLRNDRSTC